MWKIRWPLHLNLIFQITLWLLCRLNPSNRYAFIISFACKLLEFSCSSTSLNFKRILLQANAEKIAQTEEITPDKNVCKPTVPEAPLISFSDDDDSTPVEQGVGQSNDLKDKASNLLDATFRIETIEMLIPMKAYKTDTPLTDTQQAPSDQSNDANADGNASIQMANVDNQNLPKDCVIPANDCGSLSPIHISATPASSAFAPLQNKKRLKKPKLSFVTTEIQSSSCLAESVKTNYI